jgi:hypothetical protein
VPSDRKLSKFNSAFTENRIEEKDTKRMKNEGERRRIKIKKNHTSHSTSKDYFSY